MQTWRVCVVVSLLLVACANRERSPLAGGGGTSRDAAPQSCTRPAEGCACGDTQQPISCYLDPTADVDGSVMCHEGTRYCRDGAWSECGSIFSYPKPSPVQTQAVISPDAGLEKCSDCQPNCFVVRDNINPLDAGLGDSGVHTQIGDGGGLNIGTFMVDAGMTMDASTYDAASCMIGAAPDHDCDGILDAFDPYPNDKPFATGNTAIFMDLAPGATGTGTINLTFNLNSVDVYFLLDQTTTMDGETARLKADLTTGNFATGITNCADYDFDGLPNNELKTKGIIGAIRCKIRDANFGAGFFRELPFSTYADTTEIAFRNYQDITGDIPLVTTGVAKYTTVANNDFDEDALPALNSLVSGNGMYFGTDRTSIPTRSGCPANTWGYPCFRNDSIPIVLLFTDATSHAGPSPYQRPYTMSALKIASANTAQNVTMVSGNETFATATDVGDVTNTYVSFAGDTTNMTSDATTAAFTCASSSSAPDAFYKFTLSAPKTMTLTTAGSEFNNTIALWRGVPSVVNALAGTVTTNDATGNAYNFGDVTNKFVQVTGSTSGLTSDYLASDLGCSAYSGTPDAAFKFTVSQSTNVALDTAGSAFGTSVSLFSTPPTAPTYTALPTPNTNDTLSAPYAVGSIAGSMKGFSGNTNATGITSNYAGAQLACAAADTPADGSPDAVYSFTVSGSPITRVRVSAEESTLDTVLALTDNAGTVLPTYSSPTGNDAEGSAAVLGPIDDKALRITNVTTAGLGSDYNATVLGCGVYATSRDAVYQFTLNAPQNVQIDTLGTTAFDSVLSLFRNSVTVVDNAIAGTTGSTNLATATTLGTTLNAKRYIVTGTTTGTAADYAYTQQGSCNTVAAATASPDAVYKLHLDTPTSVRLDTLSTSLATYDTVLSLHSALPDPVVTALPTGGDTVAAPYAIGGVTNKNLTYTTGSTAAFIPDVQVNSGTCVANDIAPDAIYQFTVATAGTYQIDTIGTPALDTVLGLYQTPVPNLPTVQNFTNQGELEASANPVGTIDANTSRTFFGTTAAMADSPDTLTGCGSSVISRDVYYKFTLATARTVVIKTIGSSYDTVIGLFKDNNPSADTQIGSCADGTIAAGDTITASLAAGNYYVVLKGKTSTVGGPYKISFQDNAYVNPILQCDDDGGGGLTSKIVRVLNPGTYYAVVKTKTLATGAAYNFSVKHVSWVDGGGTVVACNDNADGTTNKSKIEASLPAGDYWVVLKGKSNTNNVGYGAYTLTVQDITAPLTGFVACNENASNNTATINQALSAGSYYVVVKSKANTSGAYTLNVRDTDINIANVLGCDYASGSAGTSQIEQDLAPGTYKVIVKGKLATDKNAYKLQLRDVTALPTGGGQLNCDFNSGTGGKSYLETTVPAGTYTAVVKAGGATGSGTYKLSVRDATNLAANQLPVTGGCNDGSGVTSKLNSLALTAGTYYVGVKGSAAGAAGLYQVHFGGGVPTTDKYYTPPTYAQTLASLTAHKVKVIPILSCADDSSIYSFWVRGDCSSAKAAYKTLATDTQTLDVSDNPLVLDIHSDGSGLSKTVVDAVAALADYLEMDVGVRIVFAPDANPGFTFTIKAVDKPGDGCDPPIAEEHQNCIPGATPRFDITFTNPLAAPVPKNSLLKDPKGGYSFRAELIGNGTFIVDQVPIYIIPETTVMGPPPPQVYPTGTYTQNLAATGCSGATVLPDWNSLTWNASVPSGTSVTFGVCPATTAAALPSCTIVPVCTITGGAACSAMTPCPSGSFCSSGGNCHRITGGTCTTNANCHNGATCISSTCVYSGQPVDVGDVLGAQNYEPNLRVQIGLNANTVANIGPTVNDWSINYLCKSSL